MASSKLTLLAPLKGWSTPLDEAPDEVFAGRMLGDGVAIDPTGSILHAPCDGVLVVVPASKHAVTLRAPNGAEILLHVGIDTVGLGGDGFEMHARQGQEVAAGDRLISFDLDLLARRAKSVLTPVILTDNPNFKISRRAQGHSVEVGDFLLEIEMLGKAGDDAQVSTGRLVRRDIVVSFEHGIHARPAAMLAAAVKGFSSEVSVFVGERKANAKSPVALMALGIRKGDRIAMQASGSDAAAAVTALERAIGGGEPGATTASGGSSDRVERHRGDGDHDAGEPDRHRRDADHDAGEPERYQRDGDHDGGDARVAKARDAAAARTVGASTLTSAPAAGSSSDSSVKAVVASRGLAVGNAFQFARARFDVAETGIEASREQSELDRARDTVRFELQDSMGSGSGVAHQIAAAHLELIDDPGLVADARTLIAAGKSAGYAWKRVLSNGIDALRALSDPRMAERADDLLDLEARVLSALTGQSSSVPVLPPDCVLIANELLPSQLASFDAGRLLGICLAGGGPTSHVAIIAAAMEVPTIVAAGPRALDVPTGTPVVLDAEAGWLYVDPPKMHLDLALSQLAAKRARRAAEQVAAQREGRTADGTRIEVFANVGSAAEAASAVRNGAEGCGLLRTEFLFLDRRSPPDELEQAEQYGQIALALDGRMLTIRTLDIGGDKPIPYLPLPNEDNPALGLRGVRTSLWRPELLRVQLRAILKIRPAAQCRILLPMVTDPWEIRTVRRLLEEVQSEVGHVGSVSVGVMVETPAAALMADWITREADFVSIGTNDLTQYTLAMDRGHPELASRLDGLHPAVLRLIAKTVESARANGRPVAVCGGLASDPVATPILIGLGVHELSVVPAVIPQLKALIATLHIADCATLAAQALQCETADSVRALRVKT